MELFDTHCHLDVEEFDVDRPAVLATARRAGVAHILVPGVNRTGWARLWALCEGQQGLYPALGLHPVFLDHHRLPEDLDALQAFLQTHRPLAIGEIGLDHHLPHLDRRRQQALFEAQLAIAEALHLPVVLHVRKAHDPVLDTLRRHHLVGGFCHAFNGSLQQAHRYLELGFRLGFGGMLTYPNARHLHQLAGSLPLDAMVLETDAPDMTGFCHRYQRNSPAYLPEVLLTLAELRGETAEEIAATTTATAKAVLGVDRGRSGGLKSNPSKAR